MDYENVNLSYTTRLPFTTVQSTRSTFVKRNDQIIWRGAVESILVDNQALGLDLWWRLFWEFGASTAMHSPFYLRTYDTREGEEGQIFMGMHSIGCFLGSLAGKEQDDFCRWWDRNFFEPKKKFVWSSLCLQSLQILGVYIILVIG